MSKYKVEVVETLVRVVEVEAAGEDEALAKVHDAYKHEEIVLDADDFLDVEFHMLPQDIPAKYQVD